MGIARRLSAGLPGSDSCNSCQPRIWVVDSDTEVRQNRYWPGCLLEHRRGAVDLECGAASAFRSALRAVRLAAIRAEALPELPQTDSGRAGPARRNPALAFPLQGLRHGLPRPLASGTVQREGRLSRCPALRKGPKAVCSSDPVRRHHGVAV
jgi:hypothetical protein